jgi:hypothetical protein
MVLLGSVLGPRGLGPLSPFVLTAIDPAIPVALGALGTLAGIEFTRPALPHRWALLTRAAVESALTAAVVVSGTVWMLSSRFGIEGPELAIGAVVIGICASMSTALSENDPDRVPPLALRVRDCDVLIPACAGTVALAVVRDGSVLSSSGLVIQAVGLAFTVSIAAWLLLTHTSSPTEQRVFSIATLLLIGGVSDALRLPALLCGLVAGLVLGGTGGSARDFLERDVRYVRHPLLVLVLLVAGARVSLLPVLPVAAGSYLCLRVVAKLFGAWVIRRMPGVTLPETLGLTLIGPGIFGIAFAVNSYQLVGPLADVVLGTVVLGSIASQVVAGGVRWRR